jgi:hypothetical protein
VVSCAQHAIRKIVGNQPFVIVGKHQGVEVLERREDPAQQFFPCFGARRFASFSIDTNHLVVLRDDARLHGGYAFCFDQNCLIVHAPFAQAFPERAARLIASDHAKRFDLRSERGEVGRHVPGAPEALVLPDKIHHRHRRFR